MLTHEKSQYSEKSAGMYKEVILYRSLHPSQNYVILKHCETKKRSPAEDPGIRT